MKSGRNKQQECGVRKSTEYLVITIWDDHVKSNTVWQTLREARNNVRGLGRIDKVLGYELHRINTEARTVKLASKKFKRKIQNEEQK